MPGALPCLPGSSPGLPVRRDGRKGKTPCLPGLFLRLEGTSLCRRGLGIRYKRLRTPPAGVATCCKGQPLCDKNHFPRLPEPLLSLREPLPCDKGCFPREAPAAPCFAKTRIRRILSIRCASSLRFRHVGRRSRDEGWGRCDKAKSPCDIPLLLCDEGLTICDRMETVRHEGIGWCREPPGPCDKGESPGGIGSGRLGKGSPGCDKSILTGDIH